MFVQIITGTVTDRDGLHRQLDRWQEELAPGARGWLGSTAGVAADDRGVLLARFESADAARANSDRPEQGQWWTEAEKCFAGTPTFTESEEVDELLGGGDDRAGFVQIMTGSAPDRERMREMDARFEAAAPNFRPDVLGGVRVWSGGDRYTEAVYFTSEAEARERESAEPPEELRDAMAEAEDRFAGVEYLDIGDPWIYAPR
jgi:hypothetical protein